MKKIVNEIWFNWHVRQDFDLKGNLMSRDAFTLYRVGEIHDLSRGSLKCTKIEIDYDNGLHAVVTWEDGSTESQWNLNKIIEIEDEE